MVTVLDTVEMFPKVTQVQKSWFQYLGEGLKQKHKPWKPQNRKCPVTQGDSHSVGNSRGPAGLHVRNDRG